MIKYLFITAVFNSILNHDSRQCARTLYLGSPVNIIHKAMEALDHVLQVSNQKSAANFIGGNTSINKQTGEVYYDYLFRLDQELQHFANPIALLIRITVDGNKTFVDDLLQIEGPNGQGDVNDKLNWFLDNRFILSQYKNNFFNTLTWKNCKLIKESYTYFQEMYGERFQSTLN